MRTITLDKIQKKNNHVAITLEVSDDLRKYFRETTFFTDFTFNVEDLPNSILVVPVLTNLLPFSWLTDSVIWVNEIDYDFYNCIQPLKTAFRELHPDSRIRGTLIAAKCVLNTSSKTQKSLQLFTGGIDATATLLRIIDQEPILFNTNGWYLHSSEENNIVYDADYSAITNIAARHNIKAEFVKSNFGTFITASIFEKNTGVNWWFSCQHSLAFLGCAMVAGYKYGVSTIYIASSYTFGQYVVCISDPRIDNCIKCAGIQTIHDGYELSRQDKVSLIVNYQKKQNKDINIRVCSFNTHNCCSCEKCFRSMLALIAEGADDVAKYGFILDDTLLNKLKYFIENMAMELDHDHIVFWNDIIQHLKNNYDIINYKEVVDYLVKVDFKAAKQHAIWTHYKKDFFSIIKRKLHL